MKLGGAVQGIVMSCDVITRWWTTLATRAVKLPVGCDLCGQAYQFHIYFITLFRRPLSIHLFQILVKTAIRLFHQGKGPGRGLLQTL